VISTSIARSISRLVNWLSSPPAGADDLLLGASAGQQLVNDVIGELTAQIIRHGLQAQRTASF
jgi:hypothetical protein